MLSRTSRCRLTTLLWLVALSCAKPAPHPLGFSAGQFPVEIAHQSLAVRAEEKPLTGTAAECASCHPAEYKNWKASRHRVAFTNELYRESHTREPSAWCVNCHAPFLNPGANPRDLSKRIQAEDGISCNVCHVRNGRIFTGKLPQAQGEKPAHDYVIEPMLKSAEFCKSCHEFNFPTANSKPAAGHEFGYSDLVMQGTYSEWSDSGFSNLTCQQCHLLSKSEKTHYFAGGHDATYLRQAIRLEAERSADNSAKIRIYTHGVGHAFPTGDLFRTLRVSLYSGSNFVQELMLGKSFENRNPVANPNREPNKVPVSDTTIPAPVGREFISFREFSVPWPATSREVRYELRLEYLHPHNALVSRLKSNLTGITFKTGTAPITSAKSSRGKG